MNINVLGAKYEVTICSNKEDDRLSSCDGFCDETTREICVENYETVQKDPDKKGDLDFQKKKVLRHEIVHAFLFESGLAENSLWAQSEELVDWIAIQGPKIYNVWKKAGAL